MSRAFVREADGDTPEDLPELPISPHPNHVTPRGLAQLQARLLAAEQRLANIDPQLLTAASDRAQIQREIRWLQSRIGSALLSDPARQPQDRVEIGASVELADEDDNHYRYTIVGEDEAEPEQGRISWISPLARALKGARVGDSVTWPRPAGDLVVEVLAIHYDEAL